jgi:hypothetical protein
MGFRFRRSVKILPGVRINLSGSEPSVSVGPRGFRYTIGSKGTRVTAGIPGTGLSWTQYTPHGVQSSSAQHVPSPLGDPHPPHQCLDQLQPIQNSSAGQISALSTSQVAPILNSANRRFRLAPVVLIFSLLLFVAALLQTDQLLISLSALYATTFIPVAIVIDRYRRSVKVQFDPEGIVARVSEALSVAFTELMQSEAVWVVHAEGKTFDWKRNAGATSLTRRNRVRLQPGKPSCLRGRTKFPSFQFGSDELYLLPDAALIVVKGEVASVNYRELDFSSHTIRFIEDDRVPSDTTIADYTWRYVNKSGEPDRRFLSNTQLPVCLYSELVFRSDGGLNCKLHLSKPSSADSLNKVIEALKRTTVELPKAISYVKSAKRWPTVTFGLVAVFPVLLQAALLPETMLRNFQNPFSQKFSTGGQAAIAPTMQPSIEKTPPTNRKDTTAPNSSRPPPELKPQSSSQDAERPAVNSANGPPTAIDLNEAQKVRWVQSRLRELGFLRNATANWDSSSRLALREFKATNNLGADEKWDLRTEELLASGSALRVEQTFVGSWSEASCEPGSKPDIVISSRRAISSAGGICEFSSLKSTGSGWSVGTACSNAGEKWTATIHLVVSGEKLIWAGRDGTQTQYSRCR